MTKPNPESERKSRIRRERRLVRRFLRYIVLGYAIGAFVGMIGYVLILLGQGDVTIEVPILYAFAMLYGAGMVGGFAATVLFMIHIRETSEDEDDDDDTPDGGKREPVRQPTRLVMVKPVSIAGTIADAG